MTGSVSHKSDPAPRPRHHARPGLEGLALTQEEGSPQTVTTPLLWPWTSRPSERRDVNFCFFMSSPVCGILLQQVEQAETGGVYSII